jgi:hypothetical protein
LNVPGASLTLIDVVAAVFDAANSSHEAAQALGHLLGSGQVRFLDPPERAVLSSLHAHL